MGLFDLAAPLFSWLDGVAGPGLPWLHVVVWGLVSGAATMGLYHLASCQSCLARVKAELNPVRQELMRYDGDGRGLLSLVGRNLKLSFKHIGLTAYPALLASLPLLFVLAWLSNDYGYAYPEAGQELGVLLKSDDPAVEGRDTVRWPANRTVTVSRADQVITQVAFHSPVPVVHKREGWNVLFGNPNGYLPDDSPVSAVEFELPERQLIGIGPDWMHGWMFLYFSTMVIASLAIKFAFKIH